MSKQLTGKVAIVTGASKGIGAAIAKGLASAGASVVVNYASSREGADKVVNIITTSGGKAISVQGDVAIAADVKRLFEATKNAFGKLDILVNNAGVFKFEPLENITEETFHWHFNTNVLGPILTSQLSLQYFTAEGGSIINIGSIVSTNPPLNSIVYSASKGALDVVTSALAKELGARKIRVNTISPGLVETEGTHRVGFIGSDREKQRVANTPLGRVGQPEDISKIVVFVASEDAGWITGERINVSGGLR